MFTNTAYHTKMRVRHLGNFRNMCDDGEIIIEGYAEPINTDGKGIIILILIQNWGNHYEGVCMLKRMYFMYLIDGYWEKDPCILMGLYHLLG